MGGFFYKEQKHDFDFNHWREEAPEQSQFKLHTHDGMHEILLFVEGKCEFSVEGTIYYMNPYDIVIAQSNELHRMWCKKPDEPYERYIIMLSDAFFIKNSCEGFKKIFTNRPLGVNNLISGDLVLKNGILDILNTIEDYLHDDDPYIDTVVKGKIIELLYKLNRVSVKSEKVNYYDGRIKEILMYINENLSEELSLDSIAEHFFVNKYHLCHMFKEQTGYTVNKYITYKRILLVRELYAKGASLTDASIEAGFGSYSNFYKMYMRETGKSPKTDLSTR